MKSEDKFGLSSLWNAMLEIEREFDQICRDRGLTYYAAYGTALGAVRHKGFIPWDDDFDVCMPREDFDRFLENADKWLPPHLKLVSWHNTPEYPHVFAKIMEGRRDVVERVEKEVGSQQNQGIFIDIFPVDGLPNIWLGMKWWNIKYLFLRCIEWDLEKKKPTKRIHYVERVLGFLCHLLMPWVRTQRDVMPYLEKLERQVPLSSCKVCGVVCEHTFFIPKVHRKEVFGIPVRTSFHDMTINIPSDADAYLKSEYGDYMKLPPPEKQVPHHGDQCVAPWKYGPTASKAD